MKKETLVLFSYFIFSMFLVYYVVPGAIVLLGNTAATYYKTQFYWQLVVSLIYSGYAANKSVNEKQINAEQDEFEDFEDKTSN